MKSVEDSEELKKKIKIEIKNRVMAHGMIVYFFERFFNFLQLFPPQRFIRNRIDSDDRRNFSQLGIEEQKTITLKRVPKIDRYILTCVIVEIGCIFFIALKLNTGYLRWICIIVPFFRFIDILQTNANILIFDPIRTDHIYIASPPRLLINSLVNFFEILILFGIFYNFSLGNIPPSNDWTDGFYFSVITQLTVGYGDIHPIYYFKIIASIQAIFGYLFIVLIIGSFLGILSETKKKKVL
jgi:hypothetical protein